VTTEELPVPLRGGQAVGDADRTNRQGDARDIRRPRVSRETLIEWRLPTDEMWAAAARPHFDGRVVIAKDLMEL